MFSSLPNSVVVMRGPMSARALIAFAAFAAAIGARPAWAQCRLCDVPILSPEEPDDQIPLEISVDSDLNFDRLLMEHEGAGTARLMPDGVKSATGSIGSVGGRADVARIIVRGAPGRPLSVRLPDRIDLQGLKGGMLVIDSIVSDLPDAPTLDSAGQLVIQLGGEVRITGESDGDYRGSIPVSVDYL
jgi:hypothetical protein